MAKTPSFKRVILYARQHRANPGINETLQKLPKILQQFKVDVFLDEETARAFSLMIPVLPRNELTKKDLMLVVGGDGSLLSASQFTCQTDTPVLGINRGRLGFLADISPKHLESELGDIFEGNYLEESRFFLSAHTKYNTIPLGLALNDMVLGQGQNNHLIDFDIRVNTECVSHYRADGLIIATPTGSTAYALSAGGPIMHPELNAIVMVPMFCHSLSSRPLVVSGDAEIEIHIRSSNEYPLTFSCDGREHHNIPPDTRIYIQKYAKHQRLLHPVSYRYYDTLRSKLGWDAKAQG